MIGIFKGIRPPDVLIGHTGKTRIEQELVGDEVGTGGIVTLYSERAIIFGGVFHV